MDGTGDADVPGPFEVLRDEAPLPDEVLTRRETGDAVRQALGQLPEEYRSVLVLRHYENLKLPRDRRRPRPPRRHGQDPHDRSPRCRWPACCGGAWNCESVRRRIHARDPPKTWSHEPAIPLPSRRCTVGGTLYDELTPEVRAELNTHAPGGAPRARRNWRNGAKRWARWTRGGCGPGPGR